VSWLLAFVGFALLIILHELGHFTAAKAVGMHVDRFSLFFPPHVVKKKWGDTEYAIGVVPLGGYVKIAGMNPEEELPDEIKPRAYFAQPVWKRIVVIAAGPFVNLVLAFVLLFIFFWGIGPEQASDRVGTIQRSYPAAEVLKPGDRLIAVDGKRGGPAVFQRELAKHKCPGKPVDGCKAATPATLLVERDGRRMTIQVRPIYDAELKRPRLGFSYAPGDRKPFPADEALDVTVDQFWFITKATVSLPARIFDAEKRKEISGVVGSYEVTRQSIEVGTTEALFLLAIISLSLGVINLFPFLPLDGGHIFWAIVEKIRRKPVPLSVMERASVIGFMLVIGLFVIGFTNDINRLTGEGFNVR
jgi:regulator of sigma E protease